MRFNSVRMVVLLWSAVAIPSQALAQSASPEVRHAARHVVTLRGYDDDGRLTAQGSGFFFGPGRIATNFHVIRGATRIRVVGVDGETLGIVRSADAVDERFDLAVLPSPVDRQDGLWLETFLPEIGDHVWAYGSPRGLSGTMTDGIVSAIRDRGGRRVVQVSAPISPGSSGGPVLDGKGRVIAVTTSSIRGGQNLNFAVPARELARLAATRGGERTFPIGEVHRRVAGRDGADGPEDASGGAGERRRPPERWQFLARNMSEADLYFDSETVARRDDGLRIWIYTLYPKPQEAGGAMFDASKALFEFRCGAGEFRLSRYLLLREERVIGASRPSGGGEWSAAAPDTVAEGLLSSVCGRDPT